MAHGERERELRDHQEQRPQRAQRLGAAQGPQLRMRRQHASAALRVGLAVCDVNVIEGSHG